MSSTEYWFAGSTEEFTPPELVAQAQAAEDVGFDALGLSDHFGPWFPGGQGSQAWVTLAAIGAATTLPLATGVTPVQHHYHPGVVAQAFAALEALYPGRVTLGVGSGESVNESPFGLDWPSLEVQQARFDAGLEAINRLWDGETVTMDGGWFRLHEAKLFTLPEQRPRMIVSAFGPKAARIAAERGDGLWTLGDPDEAPAVIDAYRAACSDLGKEPGTIVLQSGIAWASSQDAVIEGARKWKPTQLPELYVDDISDQHEMQRRADAVMTDEEFAHEGFIASADLDEHAERIREIEELGADAVCLQLIGSADPMGTIAAYGSTVLPALCD
ncbi:TIGR03557 family F420-dependent LLM class oxidoreductase [Patulibacter minatonensis]|uniref:TIGR03557 family F420-dependent LLM class oxidoreductase n=1 Tax=Patulibacter minatonensis TaxID=298163 RepID=UPI000688C521|nr:TIGR03557 family F420-dependent LLM class oxidoreductase [Patulibacter minatonensis]